MINNIVFYIVVLFTNIVQGITGFAGTILAMPPSLMLVGYDVAKPVLNVLGLLSGIYVFCGRRKCVDWREVRKIILVMAVGILAGFVIASHFAGKEKALYKILGAFVLFLSVEEIVKLAAQRKGAIDGANQDTEWIDARSGTKQDTERKGAIDGAKQDTERIDAIDGANQGIKSRKQRKLDEIISYGILALAGIVHGMFVCGGPLLIGYLTKRIKEKKSFRATISTVWIVLNSMILVNDIRSGLWNLELVKTQIISIPFLLVGMWIGSRICERISQRFFLILTYVLLFVSGCSLFIK